MTDCLTFCNGDIIASHTWEKPNSAFYNYDGELPHIHFDQIKQYIKKDKLKKFYRDTISKPFEHLGDDEDDDVDTSSEEEITTVQLQEPEDKIQSNLEKLKKLIACYTYEWMADFKNFTAFSMAFKNAFDGKHYKVYDEICSQFPKYDPDDNLQKWSKLRIKTKEQKGLGFGSFVHWAKEQNPIKYAELFPNRASTHIDWSRLTEATFAETMYNLYFKDKDGRNLLMFLGQDKTPIGYLFNGVYWVNIGKNMCLIKKGYFNKLYKYYMKQLNILKASDEVDEDNYHKLKGRIQELDKKLMRDRIIGIVVDEHWEKEKAVKWNENNNLFVFENKIYDLEQGEFIEPRPDQYINMTCGYEYEEDDFIEEKEEIHRFLDSILDAKNRSIEKPYLLKVLASFLRQCNQEEVAYFFTGKGRNGKGTLSTLLSNVLGEYWGELNIEYYTHYDKGSNIHRQNLYNCRHSRVINTSEISDADEKGQAVKFISDKFKRITGGDTIEARKCGSEEIAYFKAGKVLIQTNTLPEFSKLDTSLKERIIVMKFPYTFTDDENLLRSDKTVYKTKDKSLKDKFNTTKYKTAFINILFENYKVYKMESLKPPKSVKEYTLSYFDNSTTVKKWFFQRYKSQFDGMTEAQKKAVKKKDFNRILISDLKNNYVYEEGIENKLSVKEFLSKLSDIDGFDIGGAFIKKNTDGHYELQKWIQKPIEEEQEDEEEEEEEGEEECKQIEESPKLVIPIKKVVNRICCPFDD